MADTNKSTQEVLVCLDQSILGSELATAYRKWENEGCPDQVEDGGYFWDEVRMAISDHRKNISLLVNSTLRQRGPKAKVVFSDDSVLSALIR
ncbi:MAG: hypothetical protein WBP54_07800 [Pelodictyon phaeoclathratiforme]